MRIALVCCIVMSVTSVAHATESDYDVSAFCMEQRKMADDLATYMSALLHRNSQNFQIDAPLTFADAREYRKIAATKFGAYNADIGGGAKVTKNYCREKTDKLRQWVASQWTTIEQNIRRSGKTVWKLH